MKIGIIGAMPEEISGVHKLLNNPTKHDFGLRTYYSGTYKNHEIITVLARIGKVAVASTATTLIDKFNIDKLILTGVAGAISDKLNIGDIVVADKLIQHDMDASAVMGFKKFEIPLLEKIYFETDLELRKIASESAREYVKNHPKYHKAKVYEGIIGSGDQFINQKEQTSFLRNEIPDILAVEMEGASVSQVCYEWNIPCCVIRSISDKANDNAHIDFAKFVAEYAAPFSSEIIKNILDKI